MKNTQKTTTAQKNTKKTLGTNKTLGSFWPIDLKDPKSKLLKNYLLSLLLQTTIGECCVQQHQIGSVLL